MRQSVRGLGKRGVKEYPTALRTEWVLANPAQLVIVVSQIFWCQVGRILWPGHTVWRC